MNLFFINNNTSLFCSILAIEHLGLDWTQCIAGLSRKTDGHWLPFAETCDLETAAGCGTLGQLIKGRTEAFDVFLPHDGAGKGIRRRAINHPCCRQVYYLEEGMLSHKAYPYRLSSDARKVCNLPFVGRRLEKLLEKPLFGAPDPRFLALGQGAFPFADVDRVITLDDHRNILRYYSPRIHEPAFIMLATPAEAFEPILQACKDLAGRSYTRPIYLKLHPDAYKDRYQRRTGEIISAAGDVGASVLDPGTLIEAEILLNRHHLIGNRTTSLVRYSTMLGGAYTAVDPGAGTEGPVPDQPLPG